MFINVSRRHPFILPLSFVLLVVVSLSLSEATLTGGLDLSEWLRSSRQLSGEDGSGGGGGVALGLVSALQKWANSLETKMVGLKDSNVQLIQVLYFSNIAWTRSNQVIINNSQDRNNTEVCKSLKAFVF